MKANGRRDDPGVSMIVEYILTFMIASVLFTIVLLMSNNLFIEGPQRTVSTVQFTDVGNDISAKIIDTYLIVPASGNISTTFDIPLTVAEKQYDVNIQHSSKNYNDMEVVVYSKDNGVSITTTLNGINSTIPVSGNTSSAFTTHRIYYQKV